MSRETRAGHGARIDCFKASSSNDQRDLRILHSDMISATNSTISDASLSDQFAYFGLQHQLTELKQYMERLNGRLSHIERKLDTVNTPMSSPPSYQTVAMLRSESSALDMKCRSDGLSQQHLQSELYNTNAGLKDVEDLYQQNCPCYLKCMKNIQDCLRILVKTELNAIIEESVRNVIENNNKMLESTSTKTLSTEHCQGNDRNSDLNDAQGREKSQEQEDIKLLQELLESNGITSDEASHLDQRDDKRDIKRDRPESTFDAKLQSNTREAKIFEVEPVRGTTEDDQLKYTDNAIQDKARKNVDKRRESLHSTKELKQQMSIDSRIEDTCVNNVQETQKSNSNRTLNQQVSLEGKLESIDEGSDIKTEMHPAAGPSNRTLNQQMSLEGRLEASDESDVKTEVHPASIPSNRSLNQQMSLEGRLEATEESDAIGSSTFNQRMSIENRCTVEAGEREINRKRFPAVSMITLNQQISFEGRLEEDASKNTFTETHPTRSTANANAKMVRETCMPTREHSKSSTLGNTQKSHWRPKSGGIFRKKWP